MSRLKVQLVPIKMTVVGSIERVPKYTATLMFGDNYKSPKATYNGIELPNIDFVWTDRTTYPYAVITEWEDGNYGLYICTEEMYVHLYKDAYNGTALSTKTDSGEQDTSGTINGVYYVCKNGKVWEHEKECAVFYALTNGDDGTVYQTPIWASYDLLDSDGNSYFADVPVEPDIPDEPTATQYLYGHVADSTVTYNGVELPDIESVWTDEKKQTHPYALLFAGDGSEFGIPNAKAANLTILDRAVSYDESDGACIAYQPSLIGYLYTDSQEIADALVGYGITNAVANAWFVAEERTSQGYEGYDGITWTSHDILNTDGSVYLSASEPVHSYSNPDVIIDGVGYVGEVLPALPVVEGYESAVIVANVNGNSNFFMLYLTDVPLVTTDAYSVVNGSYKAIIGNTTPYSYLSYQHFTNSTEEINGAAAKIWEQTSSSGGSAVSYALGKASGAIWTNADILNEDGTVCLPATDPIPLGELVGYGYNGVTLPDINEVWTDKEQYPYAYMVKMGTGKINLYLSDFSWYVAYDDTKGRDYAKPYSDCSIPYYNNDGVSWNYVRTLSYVADHSMTVAANLVWTNTDISNNNNGSVYLAASDPIPVYE